MLKTHLVALLDEPLVVLDVGCRWGFAAAWEALGDHARIYGFEPDDEECKRLREAYRDQPWVRIEETALGRSTGTATLYVTANPVGSSLYPAVTDLEERHPDFAGSRVERTIDVATITLDEWAAAAGVTRADVIKLDTQGSELEILQHGTALLSTTRMIECEVSFNSMYEGSPLFGEVDRWLRGQGFVLWTLNTMAHYGLRNANNDLPREFQANFDSRTVSVPALGGQLYWADAFYVRADLVDGRTRAPWTERVRDALVADGLGFPDLAWHALTQALDDAPPAPRRALEHAQRALGPPPARGTIGWKLEPSPVLDDEYVTNLAHTPDLTGFGPLEQHPFGAVRWTEGGRDATVDLPVRVTPGAHVEILSPYAMTEVISQGLVVEVNGLPLDLVRVPHEHGTLYVGRVPASYASPRSFTRLHFRTPYTVPSGPDGETPRGVAIAWIRLTAPQARGSEEPGLR